MTLQGGRGQFLHQDLRKELAEEIWGGSCDGLASGPRDRKGFCQGSERGGDEVGVRVSLNVPPPAAAPGSVPR